MPTYKGTVSIVMKWSSTKTLDMRETFVPKYLIFMYTFEKKKD